MRRWESGTSWVLERLWDFFLAPSPSGAVAGAGSKGQLQGKSTRSGSLGSGDGDAKHDRSSCSSNVEGCRDLGLGCTSPLARSISQRLPRVPDADRPRREGVCFLRPR